MKRLSSRAAAVFGIVAAAGLLASSCAAGPTRLSYIVVPHPDDEMQAWSLIEDTADTYKVFIMLTKGEQTAYCTTPGYDVGTGEAEPFPWPAGKFTPSCEAARQNSFFNFVTAMAASDSGLPSSFTYRGVKGPFDSLGRTICRHDNGNCVADLTAEVWTSQLAAVVWFNLGDGDVTPEEVAWAVNTVRDNRSVLDIDSSLPPHSLIGASFWNARHADCFIYEHLDHRAVQEALWTTDYGVGYQAVATCRSDPSASRHEDVTAAAFDDAFETGASDRIGQHVVQYGWLWAEDPGYWPGDHEGQSELFHRQQSFWVRYGQQ